MKILLIYPYFIEDRKHDDDIRVPPMGIYSVAAVLREHDYDVEILNWHDILRTPDRIEEVLRGAQPHIIGFSVLNGNRWGGIDIARTAKRVNPDVKIVFGGIGATFLWEHLLSHFPEIDFIITGEGEYPFLDLVRDLGSGNGANLEGVRGLAFRKKGKIVKTGDTPPVEHLDSLPIPAKYFTYQHVASSRGCPWNCAFCGSPGYWDRRVRFRSPKNFVDELELLYRKGVRFFYFSDDTFTVQKDRVVRICQAILQREMRIEWAAISRATHMDEDILYWMRRAGCIQISYGIESGSERIRDLLDKQLPTDQILRAFALTTRYGILSRAYFIYGCPGENGDTIRETLALIHRIKPLSAIFYLLDIFPGTRLYEELKQQGKVTDDIWLQRIEGILYAETDDNLSADMVLSFGKTLRDEYYKSIPGFVDDLQLIDREDLYPMHADFCSRLGMTFSHGDYSKVDLIEEKDRIAEKLYTKALEYHPDHRAYLGLGILKQRAGEEKASVHVLSEGLGFFPQSEPLHMAMGISCMNLEHYGDALHHFLRCEESKAANRWIALCYEKMGQREKAISPEEKTGR